MSRTTTAYTKKRENWAGGQVNTLTQSNVGCIININLRVHHHVLTAQFKQLQIGSDVMLMPYYRSMISV